MTENGPAPKLVMLNEVKHLGNEWDRRLLSYSAQILRFAQDDRLCAYPPRSWERCRDGRHFAENLCTVVLANFLPGSRTVDGKFGLLGESG